MTKISIIVPIYNVEKYLKKCVDSIIAQTLKDIEIILVDDGSPDNSGAIIDEYARQDSRVKAIHKENGGYGSAIDEGFKIAKGEYVAIVESDDWIAPDMYEILYAAAQQFDVPCIKANFYHCPSQFENIKHCFLDTLPINKTFSLKEHPELLLLAPSIWSAIYKRSFIEENNIKCQRAISPYEDLPFACEVYSKANEIVLLDKPLYFYRCENNQNSSTIRKDRKLFKVTDQIQITIDLMKEINSFEYSKEAIYKHIYNVMTLFVGNAHKSLKGELFNKFGDFFRRKDAKNLKFTYFDKKELKIIRALKTHNYLYYKYFNIFTYVKKHPLLINKNVLRKLLPRRK